MESPTPVVSTKFLEPWYTTSAYSFPVPRVPTVPRFTHTIASIAMPDGPRGAGNAVTCSTTIHHPSLSTSLCCSRAVGSASIPLLRETLRSLDSKMVTILNQRREVERRLEQAVRSRSPVQRLPSELLSWIFILGVQSVDGGDPLMVSALMLVCRHWTDVALDTPVLWSTISIGVHYSLDRARRRLARSKSVPLDITVDLNPRLQHPSEEDIIRVMDVVRPALWRTKSFRLCIPDRRELGVVLSRCQEDAPLLESLSIQVFHSMQEDFHPFPQLPLFNGRTPQLRSCSFTSFNFGWDVRVVSRLRILRLGGYFNQFSPTVEELVQVLGQCLELEELALRNMSDIDPDACSSSQESIDTRKILLLPRLVKASFYHAGVTRTHALLGQISFPALETLEFYYIDSLSAVLEHLVTQSFTSLPLRRLRIESTFFCESNLIKLLRCVPSLTTLELIDAGDVSSILLEALSTPCSPQPWICPRLIALSLDGCNSLAWDSIRAFIESRLHARTSTTHSVPDTISNATTPTLLAPQPLRSIDVTRCHQISKEMLQWLRMYVADVRYEPAKGVWGEPEL